MKYDFNGNSRPLYICQEMFSYKELLHSVIPHPNCPQIFGCLFDTGCQCVQPCSTSRPAVQATRFTLRAQDGFLISSLSTGSLYFINYYQPDSLAPGIVCAPVVHVFLFMSLTVIPTCLYHFVALTFFLYVLP